MPDEQPSLPTLEQQYADIRTGLNDGRARAAALSKSAVDFLWSVVSDRDEYGHDMEHRIAAADAILNFIKVP